MASTVKSSAGENQNSVPPTTPIERELRPRNAYKAEHAQAPLEALVNAMRSWPRQVQEQTITVVANVTNGEEFNRFYATFMPVVRTCS